MKELNSSERDALIIIAREARPSIEDIRIELDEYYTRSISHQQTNEYLSTLIDKEYVKKRTEADPIVYETTQRGDTILAERRKWEKSIGLSGHD